jgi:WD40 repeat protein
MMTTVCNACVENIDILSEDDITIILASLSNLQGNNWNGGISLVSGENGSIIEEVNTCNGITSAKFLSSPYLFLNKSSMIEKLIVAASENGQILVYKLNYDETCEGQNDDTEGRNASLNSNSSTLMESGESSAGNGRKSVSASLSSYFHWNAHHSVISTIAVDHYNPSVNSNKLLSCSWDGSISCWDLTTFQTTNVIASPSCSYFNRKASNSSSFPHIYDISFTSYHPSMIISGGHDGYLRVWDLRTPLSSTSSSSDHLNGCSLKIKHDSAVTAIHWSNFSSSTTIEESEETTFFTGTWNGELYCHDLRYNPSSLQNCLFSSKPHSRRIRKIRSFSFTPQYEIISKEESDRNVGIVDENDLSNSNNQKKRNYLVTVGEDHQLVVSECFTHSTSSTDTSDRMEDEKDRCNNDLKVHQRISPHNEVITDIHLFEENAENNSLRFLTSSYDKTIKLTDLHL